MNSPEPPTDPVARPHLCTTDTPLCEAILPWMTHTRRPRPTKDSTPCLLQPSTRSAPPVRAVRTAPAPASTIAAPDRTRRRAPPRIRAVPDGTEARGFALYVGIDEQKAAGCRHRPRRDRHGPEAARRRARARRRDATRPSPSPPSAPADATSTSCGSRCRTRPRSPSTARPPRSSRPSAKGGVVIDISRKRVQLDGETAPLTYKEFELLQFLVLREGRTIDRAEIISTLWGDGGDEETPERAHDRRARAAPALEARRLRGHRAHRARRRIPVRPSRGRHDPLGIDAVARHLLRRFTRICTFYADLPGYK